MSEILAQCLQSDERFRSAFLQKCRVAVPPDPPVVGTQVKHGRYGRPDVELRFDGYYYVFG